MFEPWRWPSRFPHRIGPAIPVFFVLLVAVVLGLLQQADDAWAIGTPLDTLSRGEAAFKGEDYQSASALFACSPRIVSTCDALAERQCARCY